MAFQAESLCGGRKKFEVCQELMKANGWISVDEGVVRRLRSNSHWKAIGELEAMTVCKYFRGNKEQRWAEKCLF